MSDHFLRALLVLVGLGPVCLGQGTAHGFNYWPVGFNCNILTNANWNVAANKAQVEADIDLMASLDTKVVRLMFWPGMMEDGVTHISGWYTVGAGAGTAFAPEYFQEVANLPSLVHKFGQRGIQVIIAFGNTYQVALDPKGQQWWKHPYGADSTAYPSFLADSTNWMNGFISATSSLSNILYYDLHQEASPSAEWVRTHESEYIVHVYDNCSAPVAKRGFSLLDAALDSFPLALLTIGSGRPVAFGEFHCYPEHVDPVNANLEDSYATVLAHFGVPVSIGEYARKNDLLPCPEIEPDCYETRQRNLVLDIWARARSVGAHFAANWLFWDNPALGGPLEASTGWGSTHDPKHVFGSMSELLSAMPNPDAESVTGSPQVPQWWSGGPNTISFVSMDNVIDYAPDAATNQRYARLTTTNDIATAQEVWISTPSFDVASGGTLYTNAFIRSDMSNVRLVVNEYQADWTPVRALSGPSFTPSGWSFNNYLSRVGSKSFPLHANTARVIVAVAATVPAGSGPRTLDVDTMSATVR